MGEEVNKRGEVPRYIPTYGKTEDDTFLGYADEIDVWYDPNAIMVSVVGPKHKLLDRNSPHNFDVFEVVDSNLCGLNADPQDLHIDVHDMCLIYALCVEHGVFKEE